MNQGYQKNPSPDNNISKTGYRALFLLLKLLESPKTRDELLECFKDDSVIRSNLSKDSVTNTVNALRKTGCIITRPTQRTNNRYILKSHPFTLHLTRENVDALQAIRESIVSQGDWLLLINLNNLYAKAARLAPDDETKHILLYDHPLRNINLGILTELLISININQHTNICYDSPEYGEENLTFTPEFVTLENRKLYVWGYCTKHGNSLSYLRIDRIKKVNLLNFLGTNPEKENFTKSTVVVDYKLKNLSAMMFVEHEDEMILKEDKNDEYPLTIRAFVNNKFNFFQRILSYGTDCLIISPEKIKKELLEKLKSIKAEYMNESN